MNWFVYIAKSRNGLYYTGMTTDTRKRIIDHNSGRGSLLAKQQGPFVLLYKSSPYKDKPGARKRESQIKKWSRLKKEKLIKGEWD